MGRWAIDTPQAALLAAGQAAVRAVLVLLALLVTVLGRSCWNGEM